jgi:hypothetical protein
MTEALRTDQEVEAVFAQGHIALCIACSGVLRASDEKRHLFVPNTGYVASMHARRWPCLLQEVINFLRARARKLAAS